MDAEQAKQRLADERARIEKELEGIGKPISEDEPENEGDAAEDLQQDATDDALRESLRRTLQDIQRAEQRLEEGTYGKSVVSGEPIPDERLDAVPWADRLVDEA
jgi:DnaK suppressor protein